MSLVIAEADGFADPLGFFLFWKQLTIQNKRGIKPCLKKTNTTLFNNQNSIQNKPFVNNKSLNFFFNELWGENIPNGFLVLWTKQDKKIIFPSTPAS